MFVWCLINGRHSVVRPFYGPWSTVAILSCHPQEVDFSAASLFVTESRREVVDFPAPYFRDSISILIQRPREVGEMTTTIVIAKQCIKERQTRIQIPCRRHPFWSYPAGLTKAEVSPSVCTPLSPSLFTPHQILYSPSLTQYDPAW